MSSANNPPDGFDVSFPEGLVRLPNKVLVWMRHRVLGLALAVGGSGLAPRFRSRLFVRELAESLGVRRVEATPARSRTDLDIEGSVRAPGAGAYGSFAPDLLGQVVGLANLSDEPELGLQPVDVPLLFLQPAGEELA
jgi:hypothetical protein